jgi:hypothetical protein
MKDDGVLEPFPDVWKLKEMFEIGHMPPSFLIQSEAGIDVSPDRETSALAKGFQDLVFLFIT